jgi:hypothetical protein
MAYMRRKKEDLIPKTGPEFLKQSRETSFRALMSKDHEYVTAKQKVMQPIFDLKTGNKLNIRVKNNWVAKMIQKNGLLSHY